MLILERHSGESIKENKDAAPEYELNTPGFMQEKKQEMSHS